MSKEKYILKFLILSSFLNCGLNPVHGQLPNYKWCAPSTKQYFLECLNTSSNVIVHAYAYQDNSKHGILYSIRDAGIWTVKDNPSKKLVMIAHMERNEHLMYELERVFEEFGPNEHLSGLLETYLIDSDDGDPIMYWTVANSRYRKVITFLRDTSRKGNRRYWRKDFEQFYNSSLEITKPPARGIVLDAALASKSDREDFEKYLINFNVVVFASRVKETKVYAENLGGNILAVQKFATVKLILWDEAYDKVKPYLIQPTTTGPSSTITSSESTATADSTSTSETTETNSTSEVTETTKITESEPTEETEYVDDDVIRHGGSHRNRISIKLLAFLVFSSKLYLLIQLLLV